MMKQLLHSYFLTIKNLFSKKNSNFKDNLPPPLPQHEFTLISHYYEGQRIQVLMQDKTGKKTTHDIQYFAKQKELISQVSSKDAFLLGYLLAEDSLAKTL